jgi:hypothetical protein
VKHDALKNEIRSLERFRQEMSEADQEVFSNLIQLASNHASISYLAPRQSPFEQLALTMLLEIHKETQKIADDLKWKF